MLPLLQWYQCSSSADVAGGLSSELKHSTKLIVKSSSGRGLVGRDIVIRSGDITGEVVARTMFSSVSNCKLLCTFGSCGGGNISEGIGLGVSVAAGCREVTASV